MVEGVLSNHSTSGKVQIILETVHVEIKLPIGEEIITIPIRRPVVVEGPVVLTETKGRVGAPIPIAFADIQETLQSMALKNPKQYAGNKIFKALLTQIGFGNYSSTNTSECDKGHIFALSNGGPDISENIIPQLGRGFQQNGEWREMERNVSTLAGQLNTKLTKLGKNLTLFFSLKIEYASIKADKPIDENNIVEFINMYTAPFQYTYSYFPCVADITPYYYNLAECYFALAKFMSDASIGLETLQNSDFIPLDMFENKELIPLPYDPSDSCAKNFFVKENIIKYTTGINSACGFGFGLAREKECYIDNVKRVCLGT